MLKWATWTAPLVELWRSKNVPFTIFRKVGQQPMEGEMDVSREPVSEVNSSV